MRGNEWPNSHLGSDQAFYDQVAAWLRALRRDSRLNLAEAAGSMGLSPDELEAAELTGVVSPSQLKQVAQGYQLDQEAVTGEVLKIYLATLAPFK